MNNTSIIVKNVSVTQQGNELLKDISFTLQAGEHLAVVGASGSGKTLLAKVLAGQVFAKGSVTISWDETSLLNKKIVVTEQRNQFKNLVHTSDFYYQQRFNSFDANDAQTVWQSLQYVSDNSSEFELENLLKEFDLFQRGHAPLIQLSSGENKRFQLVKAILSKPQILILDSPFTGLDSLSRKHLYKAINKLADQTKIILISNAHQLPECITHIALLEKGTLQGFTTKTEFGTDKITNSGLKFSDIYSLPVSENKEHFEYVVNMRNVNIRYGDKTIFQNINWQIKTGDKWLLKGSNGAGKSTLLSLISGDNPQAYKNEIYLFDKRRGSGESIWDIKKRIGFISPELHAFYDKGTSCYNAIASGFWDTIGLFKKLSQEQHEVVQNWIGFLNFSAIQNQSLHSLSFGIQRLILLVRALVKNPPLLILDEPCQGLDDEQKDSFVSLINHLSEHYTKTLIYVSHYDNEVPLCIDNVFELKSGNHHIYSLEKAMVEMNG